MDQKTICYPIPLEGSHESIWIQMYKHRSAPVITPNKYMCTHTHAHVEVTDLAAHYHIGMHKVASVHRHDFEEAYKKGSLLMSEMY